MCVSLSRIRGWFNIEIRQMVPVFVPGHSGASLNGIDIRQASWY